MEGTQEMEANPQTWTQVNRQLVRPFMMVRWVQKDWGKISLVKGEKSKVLFRKLILRFLLDTHIQNYGFQDGAEWMNRTNKYLYSSQVDQVLLMIPCVNQINITEIGNKKYKTQKIFKMEHQNQIESKWVTSLTRAKNGR